MPRKTSARAVFPTSAIRSGIAVHGSRSVGINSHRHGAVAIVGCRLASFLEVRKRRVFDVGIIDIAFDELGEPWDVAVVVVACVPWERANSLV
jgi:hypothetical protein